MRLRQFQKVKRLWIQVLFSSLCVLLLSSVSRPGNSFNGSSGRHARQQPWEFSLAFQNNWTRMEAQWCSSNAVWPVRSNRRKSEWILFPNGFSKAVLGK